MSGRDDLREAIAQEIGRTIARKIAIGIALFIAFLLFIVLGGWVVQLLWNWLLPGIFNVRAISIWEALGLLALSRILFGGFGKSGGSHDHGRRGRKKEWWKQPRQPTGTTDVAEANPSASTPTVE